MKDLTKLAWKGCKRGRACRGVRFFSAATSTPYPSPGPTRSTPRSSVIRPADPAAILLVEGGGPDLVLTDADFPREYKNKTHPEDYLVSASPIKPLMVDFEGRRAGHRRLICRISWQLQDGTFLPMSFVVDTGAPSHFYLCDQAFDLLVEGGRLKKDGNGNDYLVVFSRNALVAETPENHRPANILGLTMISELRGIFVGGEVPQGEFRFGTSFDFF